MSADSDADTFPAFGPPGIDDLATALRGHPGPKTVGTFPLQIARLKSSFHDPGTRSIQDVSPVGGAILGRGACPVNLAEVNGAALPDRAVPPARQYLRCFLPEFLPEDDPGKTNSKRFIGKLVRCWLLRGPVGVDKATFLSMIRALRCMAGCVKPLCYLRSGWGWARKNRPCQVHAGVIHRFSNDFCTLWSARISMSAH